MTEKVVGIVVTLESRSLGKFCSTRSLVKVLSRGLVHRRLRGGPGGTWFGSGLRSTVVTTSSVWVCWIRHRWAVRTL